MARESASTDGDERADPEMLLNAIMFAAAVTMSPQRGSYRTCVENEPWARARDFGRLRDIGMWFWNRSTGETVIPVTERF